MWQGTRECVFFLAQVNELPSSTAHREKLEAEEKGQRRPSTAPRETKRTRRKQTATSLHNKYDGYEELLTVKPDPAFLEPKGTGLTDAVRGIATRPCSLCQGTLRAWQHRCPLLNCPYFGGLGFFQRLAELAPSPWVKNLLAGKS